LTFLGFTFGTTFGNVDRCHPPGSSVNTTLVVLADVLLTSTTLVVRLCTAAYSSASTTYY